MHPKYWKQSRNHMLRKPAEEGESGGSAALDMDSAAAAFSSLEGSGSPDENEQPAAPADESPEAAAERLAAEEAEGEQPEAKEGDPAEPAKFTIKVDGKDVELTEAEVAEHYKNGLRQADYTRKTMETAEARKTADAEASKAKSERDRYAQELNNYAIQMDGGIQEQSALLTDELWEANPHEYLAIERTVKQRQANLDKAQRELAHIGQQKQQEEAEARQSSMQEQQAQLLAKLPEWKDPAKAQTEANAIKKYLTEQGFTPQECDFTDHRHILLARSAMQHAALLERAKTAVQKVRPLPAKVERPGSPIAATDGRTAAMKRLASTNSLDDAAKAFSLL